MTTEVGLSRGRRPDGAEVPREASTHTRGAGGPRVAGVVRGVPDAPDLTRIPAGPLTYSGPRNRRRPRKAARERRRGVLRYCPPSVGRPDLWSPRRPPFPRRHQAVQQRLPPGAAAGELPAARRLHRPAAGAADAGAPHGAAPHVRRRAGRLGGADHGGHAALRVRPLRQEGRLAHLARRAPRRRHAGHGRRRPGADDGAARAAGARVLLGPGRPPDGDRRPGRPLSAAATSPTPSSSPPTSATPRPRPSSRGCWACPSRPARKQRLADDKVVIDAIVGDVAGKRAIILDDEIATGGSIIELLDRLKDVGCTEASVACTHGLFAGTAVERLRNHPMITEVVTTDTVPSAGRLARAAGPLGRGLVRRGDLAGSTTVARCRRCSRASTRPTRRRSRGSPSDLRITVTSPRAGSRMPAGVAFIVDVAFVLVFAAVGRATHDEVNPVLGVLATAWPFLVGLAVGWTLVRSLSHQWALERRPGDQRGRRHGRRRHAAAGPHGPGHRAVVRPRGDAGPRCPPARLASGGSAGRCAPLAVCGQRYWPVLATLWIERPGSVPSLPLMSVRM